MPSTVRVSENGRFLLDASGRPFFYLADTAWELFHRLTFGEAEQYLRDRAAKGFTVVQAVVLAELDGLRTPNRSGDLPLLDEDPTRPNEAYFVHIDAVVDLAASLGLHLGMVPTWGDKWNQKWGVGPEIFTPENAAVFGEYLGRRYVDRPVVWILGADRPLETERHHLIVRALANGLRTGDSEHLIAFHTWGPHSSSEYVHHEPWLDLHILQSGHERNRENWRAIAADYALDPVRPVMDGEPAYEDAQHGFDLEHGYLDDFEVRKTLYWALFAGAHGHTYGCWPVWSMWTPGLPPIGARRPWYEALHLPGSAQMVHAKNLLLSRPYLDRIPDQSLIASDEETGSYHVQATRDARGRFAMVYLPAARVDFLSGRGPQPVELDLTRLSGSELIAWWFDPRTGVACALGAVEKSPRTQFLAPAQGPDWVLVVDDAACEFPPPGSRTAWEGRETGQDLAR